MIRSTSRLILPSCWGSWILLALLWGLAHVAAEAQGLPGLAQDEPRVETPPSKPDVVYHSPRAAMKVFLDSMRRYQFQQSYDPEDLARAVSTMDLRGVEHSADDDRELAVRFYEVLNRVARVPVEDIADSSTGVIAETWDEATAEAWNQGHYTYRLIPEGFSLVTDLALDFERIAGGPDSNDPDDWRIAKPTLSRIPTWWDYYKARDVVPSMAAPTAEDVQATTLMQRLGMRLESSVPEFLKEHSFLLANWQWLALALVSLFGVLLGRLVGWIVRRLSARLGDSDWLDIDQAVLADFERPFSLFVMVWMILFSRPALRLDEVYARVLDLGCAFFLAVTGVWSAFRLIDVLACVILDKAHQTENRFDDMLVPLLRRSAKVFLVILGGIYVTSYLSDDLYGIVAGLSIGSLAIGFAAKDSIENLFGTVTILLDKPYHLGDWVRVGDIDGSVEQVGFRSTKVRTFYNSVITVPNSRFIAAHVDNMGARRYRRIKTMVSIAYGTPPLRIEAFCEALRELIRKHPYTRKDYYHVYLNDLAASSLDVLLYCFVETPDWSTELREKHRLYIDILKVAEQLGVEIAFPTQTIHVAKEAEPLDPLAENTTHAERMGRELADLIVKEDLERFDGQKPPPVVID